MAKPKPKHSGTPGGHTLLPGESKGGIDYETLASQWGFAYAYLTHNHELNGIFQKAVKDNWSADRFQAAVRNSNYYKKYNEQYRENELLRYSDPAEYKRRLQKTQERVQNTLGQYGGTLSAQQIKYVTQHAFDNGWDDTEIQHNVAGMVNWRHLIAHDDTQTINGVAASTAADIRQQAAAYGVKVSDNFVADRVQHILEGREDSNFYKNYFTRVAKQSYPSYAEQIDGGATVKDIAEPYMQSMAQTLELDQNALTLNDPMIKRAMQSVDPATGKPTSKPLWQFEKELRQDNRWQYTDNAKSLYSSVAASLGQMFGKL